MDVFAITKWKGIHDAPKYIWTIVNDKPYHFTKDSMNFNTIVRAFAHNKLQWNYIERKLCDCFNVENWDVRVIDAYPGECNTKLDYKSFIQSIWRIAMEIAEEIHITN